ncbi:MAG: hypothetical protein J6Y72_11960 [Bacteroidales bacterium]|nr:hypothetical protein [Bacteroidales bacterium]
MSFLNYSIREVDGELKLFDDEGKEERIGITISSKSKTYFTTWGVFQLSKNSSKKALYPQYLSTLTFNGKILWRDADTAVMFEKNGHIGWKTPTGNLVMPPIFDQIEICDSYIWAKYSNRQIFVYKNGEMTDQCIFGDEFYEHGKKGIKNPDGTILFPAIYDEIYRWSDDSDVFYTRIGQEFHYYNSNHDEILTTYRKFDGVDDELTPYYISEEQKRGTLVTMQITSDLSDPQSCVCFGQKVRLDRILKSEVSDIIRNHCEVWDKGASCVDDFNSAFTYIYSAYYAQSKSSTPIEDCLKQFEKMDCYQTSWSFMVKIWTNSNTKIANTELSKFVWHFQDLKKMASGISNPMNLLTIGYDDSLADGEVKMFQVNYFSDHCPIFELDDIYSDALDGGIDNYKAKMQLLKETLEKEKTEHKWTDEVYQSIYDEYFGRSSISGYYRHFDLKKKKELLDYLIDKEGGSVSSTAFRTCQNLSIDVCIGCMSDSVAETERAYQKIKWALGRSSSLKLVVKGRSSLDFIQDAIRKFEETKGKEQKTKLQIFKKIERLLLKNGALSAAEIRTELFDPYSLL